MSLVLAIEPDRVQADVLREMHDTLGVRLVVVLSKDDAIAAIEREVPDLILVNALLSPREEVDLVAHLRSLDNLSHLQLLTIPRLARAKAKPAAKKKSSLFGFGKKQQTPSAPDACDPAAFAEEITLYLERAREVKSRPKPRVVAAPVQKAAPPAVVLPEQAPVYEPPASFPVYEPPPPAPEPFAVAPAQSFATDDALLNAAVDEVTADVDSLFDRLGFGPDKSSIAPPVASTPVEEIRVDPVETEVLIDLEALQATEPDLPIAAVSEPVADSEWRLADSEPRIAESEWRLADSEPRIADSGLRIADSEPRIADSGSRIAEIDAARIRAEAEAALAAELQRVHTEAAQQRERELAQWQAEAEALREATIGRARAEAEEKAREALTAELARSRAESEQLRQDEIARLQAEADERLEEVTRQARQVAESEAARAFAEELARVRAASETAATRALDAEVARVHADADARLEAELERVRRESEEARRTELAAQQAAAQAEAERLRAEAAREAREIAEATAARALEAEIQRVRAEAEAVRAAAEAQLAEQSKAHATASQAIAEAERVREAAAREAREIAEATAARKLEAELQRVRAEADARLAAHQEAQVKAEKAREAAAREAHAIAEATASRTLEAEIHRVRADADARLAAELAQLRADAEQRRAMELDEMRRQVEELRTAAAEQARSAAAEAIAAEVARAAALRGSSSPPPTPLPVVRVPAAKAAAPTPPAKAPEPVASEPPPPSSSYYDLWRAEGSPSFSAAETAQWARSLPSRFQEKRWMLPAAAAALLVICGGIGVKNVDAAAWAATARKALADALPAVVAKSEAPAATAAAAAPSGDLLVETTPKGAQVIVDGTARGKTPLTVKALSPGRHKLVLESSDGVIIRREVTIRAGERAVTSELMVSGWLTVFSRIPVEVQVGGRRLGASGDGQMILSPGRHKVTFVNKKYNVRETRTVDIQAGSIASHTLKLPNGSLNVDAPAGAEVLLNGERIGEAPLRGASVPLGTHEVAVRHPSFGERQQTIDVRHGVTVTVSIGADSAAASGRSFDGLKVLSESKANPGIRKPRTP